MRKASGYSPSLVSQYHHHTLDYVCSGGLSDDLHRISLESLVPETGCEECIDLRMRVHALESDILQSSNKRNSFEGALLDTLKSISNDLKEIKGGINRGNNLNELKLASRTGPAVSSSSHRVHGELQLASLLENFGESNSTNQLSDDSIKHACEALETILSDARSPHNI